MALPSIIKFIEGTPTGTPDTGEWWLYFKSDGLYVMDDNGAETNIAALSNLDVTSVKTNQLILDDGSELTLDSNTDGTITVTTARHTIDTASDASTGNLDTISGMVAGEFAIVSAANTARTVILVNGDDNIITTTGANITLDETYKLVLLFSLDGSNVHAAPLFSSGGGGSFSSFDLAADSGTPETVDDSETVTIAGGTGIDTSVAATNTVTVAIDSTVATLTGSQTLTNKTLTTPTIGDFTNATHDHSDAANGGTIDAADLTYTPAVNTDWDGDTDPGNVDDALDQLAERVDDLEGAGGGATVVTASDSYNITSPHTTTSTSFSDVDATNASVTATLTGSGKALVFFSVAANKQTANSGFFRITDGTNHSDEFEILFNSGAGRIVAISWIFTTSAGATTYKLQFRSSDSNIFNIFADQTISMTIFEVA
jgi:hypothetical protein